MKHPTNKAPQLLLAFAALVFVPVSNAQETSIPVIPGAKGFGIMTKAGRNGTVLKVTNLNDSGPGSLREALTASGPRTVIFETSGTITLLSKIVITNPNLTVAGQTAPSPGILIKGRGIDISASDVLLQHLAIRPGDTPSGSTSEQDNRDCLNISTAGGNTISRVVVDHVSCSWSVDELFTTWGSTSGSTRSYVTDCTISNSIFAEALADSIHSKGEHSMGVLFGSDSYRMSLYRNIMAHNEHRNPLVRDNTSDIQIVNNLIHRPGIWSGDRIRLDVGGDFSSSLVASVKSNVVILHPSSAAATRYANLNNDSPVNGTSATLYLHNNRVWNPNASPAAWWPTTIANQTDPAVFTKNYSGPTTYSVTEPSLFTATNVDVPVIDWDEVKTHVMANAGARPGDRCPVDIRIISQVNAISGDAIDSPSDVGGYPTLAVNTVTHSPPSTTLDSDGDGYSDLEEWLHAKAAEVEGLDTVAPTVALTSPANNATISGTTNVTATASDNVGVVGVQFKLNGSDLGVEVTSPPYGIGWNTTAVTDGAHALTAVARDAAGNTTTSTVLNLTVANTANALFDNFEDGNASGWTTTAGTWSVLTDAGTYVYRQSDNTEPSARALVGGTTSANQAVQADIEAISFNGSDRWFGLIARYSDVSNYYYLKVSSSNVIELKKLVGNVQTLLDSASQAVVTGSSYTLRLEVSGTELKGYVNGVLKVQATDSSFSSGSVGVMTSKTAAQFDNVVASSHPAGVLLGVDDFQDGNASGWTTDGNGTWSVVTDGTWIYRQSDNTVPTARSTVDGGSSWTHQIIEADAKPLSFNGVDRWFGLVTRYTDVNNYYYLKVSNSNVIELKKIAGGVVTLLSASSFTVSTGTWYIVKLEAVGTSLKGYVNGELRVQANDSSLSTGTVGVITSKASAGFDDVLMLKP